MLLTCLELAIPALIRALTFYLDRRWGEIVTLALIPFTPLGSIHKLLIFAFVLTLAVGLFEQWTKGVMQPYLMQRRSSAIDKSRKAISKPVVADGIPIFIS